MESPATIEHLRTRLTGSTTPPPEQVVGILVRGGLAVRVGRDVWSMPDYQYLAQGGVRVPRLPTPLAPQLARATLFDIGLGLLTLQNRYGDKALRYQEQFLIGWNRAPLSDSEKLVAYYLKRFNIHYGKLVSRYVSRHR